MYIQDMGCDFMYTHLLYTIINYLQIMPFGDLPKTSVIHSNNKDLINPVFDGGGFCTK